MQWTLRGMFGVITGIALALVGTRIFGIAVVLSSLLILAAACVCYSRLPTQRRTKKVLIAVAGATTLALYCGTFLAFRAVRTYEFSLAAYDDPRHNLVVFSSLPGVQEFARHLYYPLTRIIPGHCVYPTGDQMEVLTGDTVFGERWDLYW